MTALTTRTRDARNWLVLYGEVQKDDTLDYLRNAVAHQADRVSQLEAPTKEQLMELKSEDLAEKE